VESGENEGEQYRLKGCMQREEEDQSRGRSGIGRKERGKTSGGCMEWWGVSV